jgi:zinc transport system ATP-binding protein
MEKQEPILKVENLGVRLDDHKILQDISFDLNRGDTVAILGPNGAGKSVLFRALLDILPYSGTVTWAKNIKINYIPQRFTIDRDFPLTVKEFFQFKTKSKHDIISSLRSVGIIDEHHITTHLLNQRLGWLSGGQIQRVLIAWAIIDQPDVILFDEPTAGIDVGGEETIYHLIKKLKDEKDLTVLLISHDLNIVYKYATTVLCLNKDMICYGAPGDALDPSALKELYGEATFFKHDHQHK